MFPKPKRLKLSQEEYLQQRQQLFDKFDWRCSSCGKILPVTLDHIKKRSQMGGDDTDNLRPLCIGCHDIADNQGGKTKLRKMEERVSLNDLTKKSNGYTIDGNPNAYCEPGEQPAESKLLNEGGGGTTSPVSQVNNPSLNKSTNKETLTINDLPDWYDATESQGDPYLYSKGDLEMWALRIFNSHKFSVGISRNSKRRAFNEVWDAANGESIAIAYGFNEALRKRTYSLAYVKTCAKNMKIPKPIDFYNVKRELRVVGPEGVSINDFDYKRDDPGSTRNPRVFAPPPNPRVFVPKSNPLGEPIEIKHSKPKPDKPKKSHKPKAVKQNEVEDVKWN